MTSIDSFSVFRLEITLDVILPLGTGPYSRKIKNAIQTITASHLITGRQALGSLQARGAVCSNPQPKGGIGNGSTQVIFTYEFPSPLTTDEFATCFQLSPFWHVSLTGWGFLLDELNRIIDLYRAQQCAYWWNHVGTWNIDEMKIIGINPNSGQSKLISNAWPKILSFGGSPYDPAVDDPASNYVSNVTSGTRVPFYFVLYLNGRRAFGEHNLREAKINFANSLEAFAARLLRLACRLHSLDRESVEVLLTKLTDHRQRLARAYQFLSEHGFIPSIRKKELMRRSEVVMQYRNDVMHGGNPGLSWDQVASTQSALFDIFEVQKEVDQFLKKPEDKLGAERNSS